LAKVSGIKKIKPDIPEGFLKNTAVFLDKGLKKLRFSKEEVSFLCPHCRKTIKIKI